MKFIEMIEPMYSYIDQTTYDLSENEGDWNLAYSKAFKVGFKKYKNNKDVMLGLDNLIDFIKSFDPSTPPAMKDYPTAFYVHMLTHRPDKPFWAHLWGKRIGIIWRVEPGTIYLQCVGTHNDCGVGNY